jgi:hypothetical protein
VPKIEGIAIMTDSPNIDEISTMTSEQASAALAAMSTAPPPSIVPQDSQDAKAQLDLLGRDPNWSRALFAGDRAVRDQFDKLNAKAGADTIGDALAGIQEPEPIIETTMFGELPSSAVKQVIADMRTFNISDGAIAEAIAGTPIAAKEYAATVALQSMKFGDAEWVKRLMAGSWAETREWKLMCDILSRPIAEI